MGFRKRIKETGLGRGRIRLAVFGLVLSFSMSGCTTGNGDFNGHNIVIDPPNSQITGTAPTAYDDHLNVGGGDTLISRLKASDPDGSDLYFSIVGASQKGQVSIVDEKTGTYTYTPNSGASGVDSFQFLVTDGINESNVASVILDILPPGSILDEEPVNTVPVAKNIKLSVIEDSVVTSRFVVSDYEGDSLAVSIVSAPKNGTIELEGLVFKYIPNSNYFGQESFGYKVFDGKAFSSLAQVVVDVTPANDDPIANGDSITLIEDTATKIAVSDLLKNDVELDGEELSFDSFTQPLHGQLIYDAAGSLEYTPDSDYFGPDSYSYTIVDSSGRTSMAQVGLTVYSKDDQPAASVDNLQTDAGLPMEINVLTNDNGLGDIPLTLSIVSQPSSGQANIDNQGNLTYTPNSNYFGPDSIVYKIRDADGDTALATVAITVRCTTGVCSKALSLSWDESVSLVTGYRLHVGRQKGIYDSHIDVGNVSQYVYTATIPGYYYFAVSAINSQQAESVYSNEAIGLF